MRKILFTMTLMFPSLVLAQVTQVTLWEPLPGKSSEMIATAAKGVALSKKLGLQPGLALDTHGRLHYITSFQDWVAWGKFQARAAADPAMQAFIADYTKNPSATQLESFMLDEPLSGVPGNVYQVFVWEPLSGRSAELFAKATEASKIHAKSGARIAINADQLGRMHYVMSFDSWSQWGKFQDNPSAAWTVFWTSFQDNPPGKVIQTYMANQIP
jgi:hypothetical protein